MIWVMGCFFSSGILTIFSSSILTTTYFIEHKPEWKKTGRNVASINDVRQIKINDNSLSFVPF